jgi:hypothetical protein
MPLTHAKVIAIMLLAVLLALGSASLAFAPPDGATLELNPTSGCPGQQVTVIATLPFPDGQQSAGSVTTFPEIITSYPDGLISNFTGVFEPGEIRGTFTVGDFVCTGQYTVTLTLPYLSVGNSLDSETPESVSTHFTVGGAGCPNLRPCGPVGGVVMPTNPVAITAPYLALAGLVAVSAVVLVKRRRA